MTRAPEFSGYQLSTLHYQLSRRDEHSQTGILTWGMQPHSRLPGPALRHQWPWEFVARYSGATVPDFHGVPGRLAVIKMDRSPPGFKEQQTVTSLSRVCQEKTLCALLNLFPQVAFRAWRARATAPKKQS